MHTHKYLIDVNGVDCFAVMIDCDEVVQKRFILVSCVIPCVVCGRDRWEKELLTWLEELQSSSSK